LHLAPGAYVHLLPNIGGFVGADHVAMLLATNTWQSKAPTIALDIGTNTEVSFIAGGEVTTVSCASGPAFEGYQIQHGMRAAGGAIESVRITDGRIQYQTIDETVPVGICGSGLLDIAAQLSQSGAIDAGGRLLDGDPRVVAHDGRREYVLVSRNGHQAQSDIVITQKDVRQLQLAKSAIRAGIQTLLETRGYSETDIGRVIIAGAFGSYIDIQSAIDIGMLPPIERKRFRQVGNAAGIGAKLALLSRSQRRLAETVASRATYIELARCAGFNRTFMQATYLGKYRLKNGEREEMD